MRYYLILDNDPKTIKAIHMAFSALPDYECVGVWQKFSTQDYRKLKQLPEVILINLDSITHKPFKIVKLMNKIFGLMPNYIALTSSYKLAFKAYRKKFKEVIVKPHLQEEVRSAIVHYHATQNPIKLYCVHYYYNYQYIPLDDLMLLKADNYTTDFILKNGKTINGFETLKQTHSQLPEQFQRIHRSYVINSYYVRTIDYGKKEIYLRGFDKALHFSKTYQECIETVKRFLVAPENPLIN